MTYTYIGKNMISSGNVYSFMRKSAPFYLFLCITGYCNAQQAVNRDSLLAALKISPKEDSERVTNLLNLSYALVYKDIDSAMALADEALGISKKIRWKKGTALSLREIGLVYYYRSDFLKAIDYSQLALKEGEEMKFRLFDASVYNNIANIYADLGQPEKALGYYEKLLAAAQEAKHKTYEMNAWANIGTIYVELNRYDDAIRSEEKALAIAKDRHDNNIAALIYNDMGIAYKKKADLQTAMNYFILALQLARPDNSTHTLALSLSNMAQIFVLTRKYDSAQACAMEALTFAKQANALQWERDAYETLSTVYEKKDLLLPALDAYKQFIILRDSVISDEKKQEIIRKEMQFEAEKKEAVIKAEHDEKIKRQIIVRNAAIGSTAVLVAGGLLAFVFYKKKTAARQQQREAEFKAESTDTEMKALRLQMNPHFIFNSLNSISDYISKNDVRSADTYLSKFAKVMRMILENSEKKEISLKDDLKAVELYMQLESLRMNNKFTYEINIAKDIDDENTLVPPLILQPFVENSIWHGFSAKEGNGHIIIDIKKEGNMINCIVEDNGVGRTKAGEISRSGSVKKSLGMKITRARIDIINRLKNANAAVYISDLSEGMRAEVKLPLELGF